jgi:hypothetical protein
MHRSHWTLAAGVVLAVASAVDGQVIKGVLSVTQSHMS